jgi:hypothetical protein
VWHRRTATRMPARRVAATGTPIYAGGVFFLFGFGTKQRDLGPGETRTCPNCGNTRQWGRVRQSRQLTVFFVPVARWGRTDLEVCPVCGVATQV